MTDKTVLILNSKADWYADQLARAVPAFRYIAATDDDTAVAHAAEAEVLVGLAPYIPGRLVAAMERLEWVQALTTGIESLLNMPELRKGTPVTNCGGFHGPQMSELAILLMLSLARRFPEMLANQAAGRWQSWPQPLLRDKTVCILGLGAIAETLATVCNAFGMHVTGVSDGRTEAPGFTAIWPRARLAEAAGECDFLVVLVPLSEKTRHIVDARVIQAMKPSACLVNIARGGCVDEAALLNALDAGQIAGAGLDVFATEPLPPQSRFWHHPRVIVTPHIGGASDVYHQQALPILVANLNAYAEGGAAALPRPAYR